MRKDKRKGFIGNFINVSFYHDKLLKGVLDNPNE